MTSAEGPFSSSAITDSLSVLGLVDRQPGSCHFINIAYPSIERWENLTEYILGRSSDFLGSISTSWAGRPILALSGQSPSAVKTPADTEELAARRPTHCVGFPSVPFQNRGAIGVFPQPVKAALIRTTQGPELHCVQMWCGFSSAVIVDG